MASGPLAPGSAPAPVPDLGGILAFLRAAEALKDATRSGWTSGGRRESVADHSWRLCLLAIVLCPHFPEVDLARLLQMLVVHDLGEAIGGDVPAPEQVARGGASGAKAGQERTDLLQLVAPLPADLQAHVTALWEEYETAASPEARLAKGLDKLETILQHTQGANPPDFDYRFNLDYGRRYTADHPVLAALREILDADTERRARAAEAASGRGTPASPVAPAPSAPPPQHVVPGLDDAIVVQAPDGRALRIRRAVPDDAPAVMAHLLRVGAETRWLSFGAAGPGVTEAAERAFLARAASGDTTLAVVVEREGDIVARLTFDAYPRPRTGHGGELGIAVERPCWGAGVGRRLMDLLVAWAERGGRIRKLNLRVHVDNARAIALYASLGFVVEGRITRDTIEQDGTFHDAFLMGRPIDPIPTR